MILVGCEPAWKSFDFHVDKTESGVVVDSCTPISKAEMEEFLESIRIEHGFDSINLFLSGNAISLLNTKFKKEYFSKTYNSKTLLYNNFDTTRVLKNTYIHVGVLNTNGFYESEMGLWYLDDKLLSK